MQSSSRTRHKTAFVPWLAAMVIGATVHAGWLLHELHESNTRQSVPPIHVEVDARRIDARQIDARQIHARHTPAPRPGRTTSCRHARLVPPPSDDELDELDLWIHRTDRYTYTIDRRVLDRVALADFDGDALERLGVVARALGLAEPLELRNIRAGTPLFALGLRTGDRLRTITTHGGEALERVEVAIERRGRPIELVYRLI
ncbi:MAG TPA: hypothetical protein VK034_02845 [Enhygromyxa sp.]|nr:hypothetical protein [Enhygromyxa sp.]